MNLLLIPGNPPASHYYRQWIKELEAEGHFKSSHFHVYPCFEEEKDPRIYWDKVVEFYKQKLNELDDVILIGHSVGGKVAYDLMQMQPEQVRQCFLLFPFLRSPSLRGKLVLEGVSRLHRLVGTQFFMKTKKPLSLFSRELANLTDDEVRTCLHLLFSERETMGKSKTIAPFQTNRMKVYFTAKDTWCHSLTQEEIKHYFAHQELDLTHDFVLRPQERATLTSVILKELT